MKKSGINKSSMAAALADLSFVPGIRKLIEASHRAGFELVILSDNFNFFIEVFLERVGMRYDHRYLNRLLKVCYVPATSAVLR
jgi:phosphoserine phosphatase